MMILLSVVAYDSKYSESCSSYSIFYWMPFCRLWYGIFVESVLFFSSPLSEVWPHHGRLSPFISVLRHSD